MPSAGPWKPGGFPCLSEGPLPAREHFHFSLFLCNVSVSPCCLESGCVALIGASVFENQTLAQLHSPQIAASTFPRLTFKRKRLPEMTYPGPL